VYGSIYRFEGQASVFSTENGPCYRCLYPSPPPPGLVPSCAEGGVLGVLPGLVGTIQATEAIKLILGIGEPLIGRLLLVDSLDAKFRTVKLRKNPECPSCGTREITQLIDYQEFCGVPQAAAATARDGELPEITPRELAERLTLGTVDLIDELDRSRDIVVQCKGGVRSAKALRTLQAAGFTRVWNLTGGITRYSDDVDPTIPKY
jgi:adenylyltransferase/sulfurtransferase